MIGWADPSELVEQVLASVQIAGGDKLHRELPVAIGPQLAGSKSGKIATTPIVDAMNLDPYTVWVSRVCGDRAPSERVKGGILCNTSERWPATYLRPRLHSHLQSRLLRLRRVIRLKTHSTLRRRWPTAKLLP